MICDQSCLNMIAIESRMQGDHEKLKIFLQNCLISLWFNQTLGLQMKFYRKNHGASDSLKDDSRAEIAEFEWGTIPWSPHDFLFF